MGHYDDVVHDLEEPTRALRQRDGEVWKGFAKMHRAAVAAAVVPARTKDLIALSIAVSGECDGSASHR